MNNYEQQQKLLSELIYANEQIKENIKQLTEFKNIDEIITSIKSLKNINVSQINHKIENLNFTKLITSISSKIEAKLDDSRIKIDEKAKELKRTIKTLDSIVEGLNEIDTIADNVKKIGKDSTSIKSKTLFATIFATAITTAIISFAASNINKIFIETIPNDSQFIEFAPDVSFMQDKDTKKIMYMVVPSSINLEIMEDEVDTQVQYIRFKK